MHVFEYDVKERAKLRSFFYELDIRKHKIIKLRRKSKLQNPIEQVISSDSAPE